MRVADYWTAERRAQQAENMRRAIAQGKRKAPKPPEPKLSDDDVRLLLDLADERTRLKRELAKLDERREAISEELRRISTKSLAEKFETAQSTIKNLIAGGGRAATLRARGNVRR